MIRYEERKTGNQVSLWAVYETNYPLADMFYDYVSTGFAVIVEACEENTKRVKQGIPSIWD